MTSPAERYAASRRRAKQISAMGPLAQALEDFERELDFPLDEFQSVACRHLASNEDVLVAAHLSQRSRGPRAGSGPCRAAVIRS